MSLAASYRFTSSSLSLLALVLFAAACDTRPETTTRCSTDAECTSRQRCAASRCVPRDAEDASASADAAGACLDGRCDAAVVAHDAWQDDAGLCDHTVDRCDDAAVPTTDAGPCDSASSMPCPDAGCDDGDPSCRTDAATPCRRDGMVCGSDGRTYDSACAAEEAGVAVTAETPCLCRPDGAACPAGQHCFGGFVHGSVGAMRSCDLPTGDSVCLAATTTPGMCPTPLRAWGCDIAVSDGPVDPCSLPDGVVFTATLGCETRGAAEVGSCFNDGDCPADSACYGGTGCSDVAQGRCMPRPAYPGCIDDRDCPVTQVCGASADGTPTCVRR